MRAEDANAILRDLCSRVPVIPVLVIHDLDHAVPLAEALVGGGLPVLEVTLRTDIALEVIRQMASVPGAIVGAGTLLTPDDVSAARDAGARFGVSPGQSDRLLDAAERADLPLLAGAATASEAMFLIERGYNIAKYFPAEPIGGAAALRGLAGPLPDFWFCPTGGIDLAKAPDYLSMPTVPCVGGSWVAPQSLLGSADWGGVQQLSSQAAALAH